MVMTIEVKDKITGEIIGKIANNRNINLEQCIELLGGEIINDMDDPRWSDDGDNVIIGGKRYWYEHLDTAEKVQKFDVIGGQYKPYYYGTAETLDEAKKMALENEEYWDNYQGWHVPPIYNHDDCEDVVNIYGRGRSPKPLTAPVVIYENGTWIYM